METYAGIEIGGTKLQLVIGSREGVIQSRLRLAVDPAKGAGGIREQIESELPALVRGKGVRAIGIGFGGPVNWQAGKICRSHQIEGWSEFDLAGWVKSMAGIPVVVENDANAAAVGEAMWGAGIGFDPVFYVTLGSGVGGGLVVQGQVFHGDVPGEAEIGHLRLERSGTIVEERCSGWAVDRRVREFVRLNPNCPLAVLTRQDPGHEARHLKTAAESGNESARHICMDVAEDLAYALSHVVHLVHPQVIVLGGGLSKLGEILRAAVEKSLPAFVMDAFKPGPKISLAVLGEDAVPVGALTLAAAFVERANTIGQRP